MRRALTAAFGVFVGLAFVGLADGCTFLVSFDDVPQGADATDTRIARDAARDTSEPPETGPDARPVTPCDTAFPLEQVKGCATFIEGAEICADNPGLTAYPGDRTTDLVACSKVQGATCVRHCVACAHLPSGYPDQCDQCIGKSDGAYCGTDMGWQTLHFRLLVTCTNERVATASPCAKGCDSKGSTGSAACIP